MQQGGFEPAVLLIFARTGGQPCRHSVEFDASPMRLPYKQMVFPIRRRFRVGAEGVKQLLFEAKPLVAKRAAKKPRAQVGPPAIYLHTPAASGKGQVEIMQSLWLVGNGFLQLMPSVLGQAGIGMHKP